MLCNSWKKQAGFTLIDLSIFMVVIGLMMVPALKAYDIYAMGKRSGDTNSNMDTIAQAIKEYYFLHEAYPCPADLTKSVEDMDYGESMAACDTLPTPVITGGVPFKALKIPVTSTLDGWNNKIQYAVTTSQTVGPINPTGGAITAMGWLLQEDPPGTFYWEKADFSTGGLGHYLLFSTGHSGIGGYSAGGQQIEPCPVSPDETAESENCDNDGEFLLSFGRAKSDVPGPEFYDDMTFFQAGVPTRIWNYAPAPNNDDIFSNIGNIGIGTDEPEVPLDVDGNIQTEGGNASASILCINSPTDFDHCVSANAIAGTGIWCGSGEAMTGISKGDKECNLQYIGTGTAITCPAGQYLRGIDAGGTPTCADP